MCVCVCVRVCVCACVRVRARARACASVRPSVRQVFCLKVCRHIHFLSVRCGFLLCPTRL